MSMGNVGVLTRARWWLLGAPSEGERQIQAISSHDAGLLRLARVWAVPMMLVFSLGAVITLGKSALTQNLMRWQAHQPLDVVGLASLAITVTLVIGLDLYMVVGSAQIRDAQQRGESWRAYWLRGLLVALVGALEATTYVQMVAGYEHPTTTVAWIWLGWRGGMTPIIAVMLALSSEIPVSRKDIQHLLLVKSGAALLNELARMVEKGRANMAQLWSFFSLVNGATEQQIAYDERIVAAIERMTPEGAQAATQAEQRERERDNQMLSGLFYAMQNGTLPPTLTDRFPELAGLSLQANAANASASEAGTQGNSQTRLRTPAPKTRNQRIEGFLAMLEILPARRPGNSKKVWMRSGDVGRLVREGIAPDRLRQVVRDASMINGATQMDGTSLIAPVDALMTTFAERHWLASDVKDQWIQVVEPLESAADALRIVGASTGVSSAHAAANASGDVA